MPKAKMILERRGSPRLSMMIPVKYRLERDEKVLRGIEDWRSEENNALTLDMSLGGMQIAVDRSLAVGDVLHFDIHLLDKARNASVYAKVIRTGKGKAGLQFLMMNDGEREALKAFFDFLRFNHGRLKAEAPGKRKRDDG
jgi:c-di-GMP-binding flagellar brake protein YcgR